nr:L-alanine exporter AlaE [Mesorhizobium liriopis]
MRSFLADTLALVSFFTVTSGLNERFVAGMEWEEVFSSRAIGAVLMVLTARPYGLWRNWLLGRVAPQSRRGELLADGFALLVFQVPIYLAIIAMAGARGSALLLGALGFAGLMLVLGRPYGLWLDWVRNRFGLEGPGQKPMSLGG